ncbi:BTB/POZ and MATH domain-containing protein 1-like [Lolium rigidum]|uniref:BTB/POZ and MATH domain-containing protein 1-like n=1 Tax=Lolium rigidum TaxID=89674 RepID=UPI001F5CFAE0|nr:BTB/POZ and MATH domain-containing protein 1-like [Lolium rigidum]
MTSAMSGLVEFDYQLTSSLPDDYAVFSDVVSAGGHDWRVTCFPNDGDFASVYLELMSEAQNVTAVFEAAFFVDYENELMRRWTVHVFNLPTDDGDFPLWGFPRFLHQSDLALAAATSSHLRIMWAVVVVEDDGSGEPVSIHSMADVPQLPWLTRKRTIAVPPSDMADHLCRMLDSAALTDVSFVTDDGHGGQAPPMRAHRAIIAARSPAFEAALCGQLLETNAHIITVPDMDTDTFKAMLRFIYTDDLPTGLDDDKAIRSLLAAADKYGLDRLKLLCAKRMLDKVSVGTVAGVLDCAETYNCPELKTKCIDYVVDGENFKKVALTQGFMELLARSPSILAEMRNRLAV